MPPKKGKSKAKAKTKTNPKPLPTTSKNSKYNQTECPFCIEEFDLTNSSSRGKVVQAGCGHRFHNDRHLNAANRMCFSQYIKSHRSTPVLNLQCPYCKIPIKSLTTVVKKPNNNAESSQKNKNNKNTNKNTTNANAVVMFDADTVSLDFIMVMFALIHRRLSSAELTAKLQLVRMASKRLVEEKMPQLDEILLSLSDQRILSFYVAFITILYLISTCAEKDYEQKLGLFFYTPDTIIDETYRKVFAHVNSLLQNRRFGWSEIIQAFLYILTHFHVSKSENQSLNMYHKKRDRVHKVRFIYRTDGVYVSQYRQLQRLPQSNALYSKPQKVAPIAELLKKLHIQI
jgi:hypothetical protein